MTASTDRLVVLVGTHNAHKIAEIATVLESPEVAGRRLFVVGADGLPSVEVEETGSTFEANATLKALAFATAASRLPAARRPDLTIADDSGLCVAALNGAPGVRSARYAGESATDADNNRRLLADMKNLQNGARAAEFVCVIVCARVPDDTGDEINDELDNATLAGEPVKLFHVEGRCQGEILLNPRGSGGFGYDPLFYYPPLQKSFAEIGDEKNAVSHRGQALQAFTQRLEEEVIRHE